MKRINRRRFLQSSLGAAGVFALGGCASQPKSTWLRATPPPRRGPNEEIRIAVVGIRGQGQAHIKGHSAAKDVRVVTLCDIDERLFAERIKLCEAAGKPAPKTVVDVRRVLEDKDVDVISIATPNHTHALITVWACQAGKDVYVQKPGSHNIFEGRQMIAAARKYGRIVQHGTQSRSAAGVKEAMKLLHEGIIGDVYMARALCFKPRHSIGIKPDGEVPEGVHYDLWLGPAPVRPFNPNRFHYEWHWNWDYGNGDIGNQGVHQMDLAVWGLGKDGEHPVRAQSMGGRYTYTDQGETPNTQVATLQYADGKMLVFEVRGRQTNKEWDVGIGNLFYGSKGYMALRGDSFETVIDGEPGPKGKGGGNPWEDFHDAVRSGTPADLNAEITKGHYSSTCCHLANIAYRLGRSVAFDPKTETFPGDREANAMVSRRYRAPFIVPKNV
ncbi:MAG: Gfo/Idh/MocA family oxidoreductase [Phycisphaerae bacterium]|nr:Gfo/Idh/MocA family oxidoreductase [Phycisphaerae bacterium]